MSSLIFLALIFLLPLLMLLKIMNKKHEHKTLPPGPNKLPIIRNLHQLGKLPHKSLQRLSNQHGPLMFLQLGSVPALVVSSATIAKEIFKSHDLTFSSRPLLYTINKLSYEGTTVSFAPYGEYWRAIRKITLVELLSSKRVQSFEAIRAEEVALMIENVANSSSKSSLINLSELLLLLANNVVLRGVFSKRGDYGEGNRKSEFDDIFKEMQELLGMVNISDFFPWMGWYNKLNGVKARLEKNFKELDSFYDKVIQEHREQPGKSRSEHEDLVDVLLQVQNDPTQEIRLTDDQIKGVLTDMFVAGSDTSSVTLIWTMTELIKNPSVMRKAQEEVRGVVKEKGLQLKILESDLPKLEYIKMTVKEALRLHPPAPLLLPRETTEKCSIGGYEIPAKTRVFINATSISVDPEYWENPEEFKPERFLNSSIDFRGQNFELLPFGAGRRGCPGTNFAVVIIELALANLLYSFDWKLPDGMKIEDIDMDETLGLAVHKKTPLCLVASQPCVSSIRSEKQLL